MTYFFLQSGVRAYDNGLIGVVIFYIKVPLKQDPRITQDGEVVLKL